MTTKTNNIIRQMRKRAGMTQSQLADAAGLASTSSISDFENEPDGPPSIATVCRIARACGLSVGYLPSSGGWRILPADFELPDDV
jgi:transcriptional regulator with XRE-family HTH domain